MHRDAILSSHRHRLRLPGIAVALLLLTASAAGALEYEIRETVPLVDPNTRLVAAGDTDGDGVLDLVLATPENPATMWIAEREGASFATRFTIDDGVELRGSGLVHDLDGDGWPEIVSGHGSDNTVRIWEADGNDSYVLRHAEPLGAKIEGRLQVGDSDGNGLLELIFGREGSPSQVILLEALADNTYVRVATLEGPGGNVSPSNVYDLDGDGLPELAMSDDGFNPAIERTRVFENRIEVYVEPSELLGVLMLGDTDGNGLGEIIGWDQASRWPRILESTGTGNEFVEVYHADGYETVPVDADADGRLELWRAIDEGSGWRDVLTLGRRDGAAVADIWNSGALFQGSAADIVDVKAIGDTNDDGRLEIAVQQGLELHILERVQPDWVWTVPYAEYSAQVPGDSIGWDVPLLGSVRFGISLQNWAGWRGTSGTVLDPYLTLATTLPVAEVDGTEFLVPGSEYEWQFPDIPDGGDPPGVGVAFDPSVAVEYTPTFTLARTVSPLEIGYPGDLYTVTIDLTPQFAELDGEPLDILNVMASVEGQPGFDAQIVAATPLDPSNPDVFFHGGGVYWSIFDITVGQTYSLELTLDLQLWETAKAVEYAPLVEGRAWYSASEYQTLGTTVSFPLDFGTWTWETTSEHTWGYRPTTMPKVGLAERVVVTPNSPPVALCQDVVVDAGEAQEADASIDAGSYDPDGDPVNLGQQPQSPYGIGLHEVTLTVGDGFGAFSQCTATVTVTGPPVTHVVTTTESTGPGSLREAVEQANADGRPTIITFDPSLAGQTIVLEEPLYLEQDGTTVDGDANGDCLPDVELTGSDSWAGIFISSSFNVIRGLVINGFDDGPAIYMSGGNPQQPITGNVVECNFLGTDRTGSVAVPNGSGVVVQGLENRIGGPFATSRNLISGNSESGITIGEAQGGTVVEGNLIGTDLSGNNPLRNGLGIHIWGQDDNRIGPDNVIAFNERFGVLVSDALRYDFPDFTNVTPDAVEVFPLIDFSGDCGTALERGDGFIPVDGGGQPFTNYFGARLRGTVSASADGDYTFAMEGRARWLVVDGVTIEESGCCDGAPGPVVYLEAGDHLIEFGFVRETGPWTAALEILGPAAASFSTAGSTAGCPLGQPGLCGELFQLHLTSERNTITRNWIHDNGDLGIELPDCEGNGPTPNDLGDGDDGPNGLLNFPEFTGFSELEGAFEVFGTAPPESTVEIFAAAFDPSGFGEGKVYLLSETADLDGDFSASITLPSGHFAITATATDTDGNTSEFSSNLGIRPNQVLVTNTAPEGEGSFSQALWEAAVDGGPTVVTFAPELEGQTIETGWLPWIDEDETTIDGDLDGDCVPDVSLSGANSGGWALYVVSSHNVVRGLRFTDFDWGIGISEDSGQPAKHNVIECNEILNTRHGAGIAVQNGSSDNRIGPGNVVANGDWVGVHISESMVYAFPEFEGLTPDATGLFERIDFTDDCDAFHHADGAPLTDGNGASFTESFGARFTATLSVDVPGDYELYIPNPDDEVRITVDGQTVLDVWCCDEASATVTLDAGDHAFELAYTEGGGYAEVRLDVSGPGSASFSYDNQPGVYGEFFQLRVPSEGNTITQNSIYDNGYIGIDLGGCGPLENDPGDLDVGANTWLNYPVLTGRLDLGDGLFEVIGTATPNSTVEIFAAAPDRDGPGEGKEYLGSATADLEGDFTSTIFLPDGYLSVTSTATDLDGNTSEFSYNLGLRPNEITVESAAESGPGSLREAFESANHDGVPTIISFDPSLDGQTIHLDEPLPDIWDDETTIDGDLDDDCLPDVEIRGNELFWAVGVALGGSNNVVRGLAVNGFAGGFEIMGSSGNLVECNYAGLDLEGNPVGNLDTGINLQAGSSNNQIGPGNRVAYHGLAVLVSDGGTDDYPEFPGLTPDASEIFPTIEFQDSEYPFRHANGVTPVDNEGHTFNDDFGVRVTTSLHVEVAGDYTLELIDLDDNARVVVDGQVVLDDCCGTRSTQVYLDVGDHDLEVDFVEGCGWANLQFAIDGPGATTFSTGGEQGVLAEFFQMRVPTEGNTITRNSIFDNEEGIALSRCGGSGMNDPGDVDLGPNTWLNHPELAGFAELGGNEFTVNGTATPESTVELFGAVLNENGSVQGKEYLGSETADVNGDFVATVSLPAEYLSITATATDGDGNTSEFSRNLGIRPNEITVTTTAAGGPGSFADAIDMANDDGTATIITFEGLPAGSTIELDETLYIYDDDTTIDGDLDGDCWPDIELSGESTNGWSGIWLLSSNNLIRGLVLNRFPGPGLMIYTWDERVATGNVVECNFIGTDATGSVALGNGAGVYAEGPGATNNRIGGPPATSRNLISGNNWGGVYLSGFAAGNIVAGNLIGTDVTGVNPLGNDSTGVYIEGADDTRVGPNNVIAFNNGAGIGVDLWLDWQHPEYAGLTPDAVEVFPVLDLSGDCGSPFESADGVTPVDAEGDSFIDYFGALFTGTLSVSSASDYTFELLQLDESAVVTVDGEVLLDEWCCDDYSETVFLESGDHEIQVAYLQLQNESHLQLEVNGSGTTSFRTDGNTGGCAGGLPGLCGALYQLKLTPDRNMITGNAVFENQDLGLELSGCGGGGPTANDPGDFDTGPNGLMNFPELESALTEAGATLVVGALDTPSAELATIELFANESADPSGYGEGQTWLGSLQPDTLGAFSATLPEVPVGQWITATATDQWGNTSEFSAALRVSETVRWATALYASAESSTSVRLTWIDPGMGETGFRIERSLDGGIWTAVATVNPDDTTHLDELLTPSTLYYYRVVAFDAGGDLRPSNVAAATTHPAAGTEAKICHQQVTTTHRGAGVASPGWNGESWLVAWQDRRDGLYDELYVQLLDANGAPTGTPVRITETDAISQIPTLRWNGSSFAMTYSEHMRGPAGEFFSVQMFARLDAEGNPVRKQVLLDPSRVNWLNNSFDETLVWDGSAWAWFTSTGPEATDREVLFYRLSEDGEIVLGPVQLTDTAEVERDVVAAWSGNEHGISWSTGEAVYFQRMEADGELLGAPLQVAGPGLPYAGGTSVAWDGARWAVAWSESTPDGSDAVMLRLLDASGTPVNTAQRISDDYDVDYGQGIPVYDYYPQLQVLPGGGYAVYTSSWLWGTWAFEAARIDADLDGNRTGQRRTYSEVDSRHSAYTRVASNGTQHLLAFNESRGGTQEIATSLVDEAGNLVAGPTEVTSGHDAGSSSAYTAGAGSPWVVPVGGGFAALWAEIRDGEREIWATVFDATGSKLADEAVLVTSEIASGPVAVGVGGSFAVAWQDASGEVFFDRFDATGASLLGGVPLGGYGQVWGIDFTGEAYGVAWREGGGVRIQTVGPDGTLLGPPIALDGAGNTPFRMQWVGAGWAVVSRAWPDLYYTLVSVDGEHLVPPTPLTSGASQFPRWVDLEWTGEHLGVTWSADGEDGRAIWLKVIGLDGAAAFPEVELYGNGRTPSLYWQGGAFHVVFRSLYIDPTANLEISVSPSGAVLGQRSLSGHHGQGHAASDGTTAGFLWVHRAEAYFETLACLDDVSPPPAPSLTGFFDGTKVRLDWTAVDDPESAVIGYYLYRDGVLIGENFPTTFSFDDYGVEPDRLYVYEVKAVNGAWLESVGGAGIETVATADTVEEIGGLLEEVSTQAFEQVIAGILADPEIPDAIAADIQASLDDLIGNNGGLAANGAADKLEKANIVSALSMMRHAIEELQTAAAQGYDTSDLQDLVTSFARLSVLTVIRIEAEALGDTHPDVVAARGLVDQGDALLEGGDYLGAIDSFKDAVQALP